MEYIVSRGTYNTNSPIRFETSLLKSRLCDYSDAYIFIKGTLTVRNTAAAGQQQIMLIKKVIFRKCAPFNSCISTIDNTQVDYAQYIGEVMPRYNLIIS